jgi:hypothetical protein
MAGNASATVTPLSVPAQRRVARGGTNRGAGDSGLRNARSAAIGGFYSTLATSKACVLDDPSELALLTLTSTDDLL